jgi:sugar (pentulose or hexulose) kinase
VVFDIGKTNLKLLVIADGRILGQRSTPNRSLPAPPYPHHDLAATEVWLLGALRALAAEHAIDAIVATGHGSGGVVVDEAGPVLPMVDYEAPAPAWLAAAYAAVAPSYLERGSRHFGGMAHLGRQVFYQALAFPDAFGAARHILTLPQYWAWRLAGVAASEVTSLAAQSHLWDVIGRQPSSLVAAMGWRHLLPPLRPAHAVLGMITAGIAAATGLSPGTTVLNGMHDSSANLYRYQVAGLAEATLLSTGTWLVGLDRRLAPSRLVEDRAMTLNADIDGHPVGGVLAMVGREVDLLTGGALAAIVPSDLTAVIASGSMALPSFVAMDGIYPGSGQRGRIEGPAPADAVARTALATLYAGLMAAACLDLLEARDEVVIDGGLTGLPLLPRLVATLRPELTILVEPAGGGTALGAALLRDHETRGGPVPLGLTRGRPLVLPGLAAYRARWQDAAAAAAAGLS